MTTTLEQLTDATLASFHADAATYRTLLLRCDDPQENDAKTLAEVQKRLGIPTADIQRDALALQEHRRDTALVADAPKRQRRRKAIEAKRAELEQQRAEAVAPFDRQLDKLRCDLATLDVDDKLTGEPYDKKQHRPNSGSFARLKKLEYRLRRLLRDPSELQANDFNPNAQVARDEEAIARSREREHARQQQYLEDGAKHDAERAARDTGPRQITKISYGKGDDRGSVITEAEINR